MQLPMLSAKVGVSCRGCSPLVAVRNLQVVLVAGPGGTGTALEVAGVVVVEVEQPVKAGRNLVEGQVAVVVAVASVLAEVEPAKVLGAALAAGVVEGDFG